MLTWLKVGGGGGGGIGILQRTRVCVCERERHTQIFTEELICGGKKVVRTQLVT